MSDWKPITWKNLKWPAFQVPKVGVPTLCILSTGHTYFTVRKRGGGVARVRWGWAKRRFKKLYGKGSGGWTL